ncbi:MAG: leucine-rich repeat domain-containing protein [Bacteroidetes bacterium]|nr:leucine-rich repeat domain-containing protein [Bacteroidota bacterium]
MNNLLNWEFEKNIKNKDVTLFLDNYNLTEIPKEIAELYWLKDLHLRNNQIKSIEHLSNLKKLEGLNISGNNIEDISGLSGLKELRILDISNNKIKDISSLNKHSKLERLQIEGNYIQKLDGLEECQSLKVLNARSNQIKDLTKIRNLKKLNVLNINNNLVSSLNGLEDLEELTLLEAHANTITNTNALINKPNLKSLNLSNNKLQSLDNCIEFKNVKRLDLSYNSIENIENSESLTLIQFIDLNNNGIRDLEIILPFLKRGLKIELPDSNNQVIKVLNNPISLPPKEIVYRGENDILEFYKDLEKQGSAFLYEAKLLILGESGAGKTTLSRKILNVRAKMPEDSESTKGIDIKKLVFKTSDNIKFQINIWDFGGQEIYHATHQFFLTQRSFYLLVCDSRKEDTDFNYWLQAVELLSGKSPLMIIQNEKFGRKVDIDIRGLKQRFEFISDAHSLDLKSDTNKLRHLKDDIKLQVQQLQHIGHELPKQWVEIRKDLEEIAIVNNFIEFNQFKSICNNNKIFNKDQILRLSRYMHDLGVFLHFQDDAILKHYIFLNNEWITNAVYRVLDDTTIQFKKRGHFSKGYLSKIWKDLNYHEMSDEIIQLMKNFELCYQIPDKENEYIAPQLLPKEQPDINLDEFNGLQIRYDYEFLPKGLISRLIVRLHKYIDNISYAWRYGMIITKGQVRALIIETYGKRNIHIRLSGNNQVEFLTIIKEEVDLLNKQYQALRFKKLIPCFCSECKERKEPFYYSHADLIRRTEKGKFEVECENSYEKMKVKMLLNRFFEPSISKDSPLKLFISYSKHDEDFKNQLLKALAPLKREEKIIAWHDHLIAPGEEWNDKILQEIEQAEIIILLVSSDFVDTSYIWDIEVSHALERHKLSEAIVIPIIIRPCDWENLPFAEINALPRKGAPISESSNSDRAWTNVVKEIRELIGKLNQDRIIEHIK